MTPKEVKGFEGHIILYCKGHYHCPYTLKEGLRMIWAIRCGYNYDKDDISVDRYIANSLYKLLLQLKSDDIQRLQEKIHEDISCTYRYEGLTAIENLIYIYCSELTDLICAQKVSDTKWESIIKLPKPNKRLFNRILRGNGRFNDYKEVDNP